jgi:hypothetical protein
LWPRAHRLNIAGVTPATTIWVPVGDVGQTALRSRFALDAAAGTELQTAKESRMNWWLILLIIVVIVVFGLGFVVKWLFWLALALLIVWIITLLVDRLRRR